ncbi:MAG TPA: hypothetical protein VNQ56_13045 [Pseudolabrys sp.]|nr:hypothetical protein [Pseudolabrys sp.]
MPQPTTAPDRSSAIAGPGANDVIRPDAPADHGSAGHAIGGVRPRLAVLALGVVAVGLPVNDLLTYALLVLTALVAFTGRMVMRRAAWLAALAVVVAAVIARVLLAPAPIEEGHNVFLPEEQASVLSAALPPPVYKAMRAAFDAQYPVAKRCHAEQVGCWRASRIAGPYAFAADGIWTGAPLSRSVTGIRFDNPVWHRLGFVNDGAFNWYSDASDLQRVLRDRRFWKGYDRWRFDMPWFAAYRFPAGYAGAQLCWRGTLFWPQADGGFTTLRHETDTCRAIAGADVGKLIYAMAIAPSSLAMSLSPPASVEARLVLQRVVAIAAILAVLLLLVRIDARALLRPSLLIGLALVVIAVDDASFIGGLRPFDGGDDGLFYTGVGRDLLQSLLAGDLRSVLIGGEPIYYYGGPGLRYFRMLEMLIFGDSNLGYLSVLLMLPVVVYWLFRRFFPDRLAWPFALAFTALPVGEVFGTSFFHYAKWAARGFADPLSQVLFVAGIAVLLAAPARGRLQRAEPLFWGSLLLTLAIFVKPIIAPMVGMALLGVGLMALAQRQWLAFVALCAGFLPFFWMPFHNWYFGNAFVLTSSNADHPQIFTMPPSAYVAALRELAHLDFGTHVKMGAKQISLWLSGPGALAATIPLHAAAVVILVYVACCGRRFEIWVRWLAACALAGHVPALFYLPTPRYFYAVWFTTAIVVGVFLIDAATRAALARWLPARFSRFVSAAAKS